MIVEVQLTAAGSDAGPFNLYSDATIPPYGLAFASNVSKAELLAGYTSYYAPDGTTIVRVKSIGTCTNYIDLPLTITTTSSSNNIYITNNSSNGYISAISPIFYILNGMFPYMPGDSDIGTHGAFSGNMIIYVNGGFTASKISIYVNYSLIDCFNVIPGGPNPYTIPVTLLDTDVLEIVMEDGSC